MEQFALNNTLENFSPCPRPPNLDTNYSKETHQQISEIINGPLSGAVIIQGILVNTLGLAAFSSHIRPRPSIYHYLIALCCWDIALLIFAGLMYSFPILLFGNQLNSPSYIPTYPWWYYFAGVTLVGCVWTITVLTCDRYLSLCHPFSYRLLKKKTIIKMLVTVAVCAAIYCSPRLFEMKIGKCNNSLAYELQNDLQATWLKRNSAYRIVYKITGGFLFISLVPYMLLLGLSVRISIELRRAANICSTATLTTKQRVDSSNRILMALIIKFLCCYFPTTILDIWETAAAEGKFLNNPIVTLMVDSSNFLVAFNSGTNFWMYIISSTFFRRACCRVLRGHCGPEKYSLKAAGIHLAKMADSNTALINGMSMKSPRKRVCLTDRPLGTQKLSDILSANERSSFSGTGLHTCETFESNL